MVDARAPHRSLCAKQDLKPENIFITASGYAKLGDF
jgi:serine/threonine protein kinase